jgi:hypothetical protein
VSTGSIEDLISDLYLAGLTDDLGSRQDITITEISTELSLPIDKVRKVIFGEDELGTSPDCVYRKKLILGDRIPAKSYVRYKGQIFLKAQATAMAVLQRGLDNLLSKGSDLTVSELKEVSTISANIDRMFRLESGMPTDIIKSMNLKPENIIAIIKNDPMYGGVRDGDSTKEERRSSDDDKPRDNANGDADTREFGFVTKSTDG